MLSFWCILDPILHCTLGPTYEAQSKVSCELLHLIMKFQIFDFCLLRKHALNAHKGSTLLEETCCETNNLCIKLTKNNLQAILIVKIYHP